MRVDLVRTIEGGAPLVVIAAKGVSGAGHWRGQSIPSPGTNLDVELEVPGDLDWRDIAIDEHPDRRPDLADDELLLQGVVEDCDQDGVLTLRIADAVVLIDTTGEPPFGVVGRYVSVVARDAEIFPTDL